MKVSKMMKYARAESKRGTEMIFCDQSPYSEADWLELSALGLVRLEPGGDDQFIAYLTDEGILYRRLRRAKFFSGLIGWLLGVATAAAAQLIANGTVDLLKGWTPPR